MSANQDTHSPSPSVSDFTLQKIIESGMFKSVPGFDPSDFKNGRGVQEELLKLNWPADKLQEIVTAYHAIQTQINETVNKASTWHLRQRLRTNGLFHKFGDSDFNLIGALLKNHSEIIGGHQQLSWLFGNQIHMTSRWVRVQMSQNRHCFQCTIHTKCQNGVHLHNKTIDSFLQALQTRQMFCNITELNFNVSSRLTMQNSRNLDSALCMAAKNCRIRKLVLNGDSGTEAQFEHVVNSKWKLFQNLSSLQVLDITGAVTSGMFKTVLESGLNVPTKVNLITCNLYLEEYMVNFNVTRLSYSTFFKFQSWDYLTDVMTKFPRLQFLHLFGCPRTGGNLLKFSQFMSACTNLRGLTLSVDLLRGIISAVSGYDENGFLTVFGYDENGYHTGRRPSAEKLFDKLVVEIAKCKHLEELTFFVPGFFMDPLPGRLKAIMQSIQSEMPKVQVHCTFEKEDHRKLWGL